MAAQRLKRVFNIDIEACPECKGNVKVIASIEDPEVIKKILNHLGLESRAPTPWPPRGPPMTTTEYDQYTQMFPNDVLSKKRASGYVCPKSVAQAHKATSKNNKQANLRG